MVITSICDPALFDQPLLEDRNYAFGLSMVLQGMAKNHLPVLDSTGSIAQATLERLQHNPSLEMQYNALLQLERIVRVPCDKTRIQKLSNWVEKESAAAVACSENPVVDVLLAGGDTLIAMKEENIDCSKSTCLQDFPNSNWSKFGSTQAIGGMTRDQFLSEIIRPVVRCAKKVTIIDKIIIRAAFGDQRNPSGTPGENWSSFKKSILAVHDEWANGLHKGDGLFEIITWPVTHVQKDGKVLLGDALAAELGRSLAIPFKQLRVMFKSEHKFRADMHDRYLITNQGIVLGFSKGFDLFASDTLGTCDVYLRKPDALTSKLMSPTGNCGMLSPKR